MKLTWLGHSCFLAEQDGYRILLDPYTGVEGYPPLAETAARAAVQTARSRRKSEGFRTLALHNRISMDQEACLQVHKILCSHSHFDHNAVEQAETVPFDGPCPFTIRTVETFHDGQGGALRGTNTVHILSAGGFTIAHLGDLGHQLLAEQAEAIGPLAADSCGRRVHRGRGGGPGRLRSPEARLCHSHALPPRPLRPAECGGCGGLPVPVARRFCPPPAGPRPLDGPRPLRRYRSPIL